MTAKHIGPGEAADGQSVSMVARFQALTHRFDRDRFQVHNAGVGSGIQNRFSIGTRLDRPKQFGMLDSCAAHK